MLPENEIVSLVRKELHDLLNIFAEPVFAQVFKWERAICQYTVGHVNRLKKIDGRLRNTPGLFLAGNSYRGIAINDCTLNAQIISDQIVRFCLTS
ncbi:MAG: FAD-dependent oxidoreductase [Pseudomonadota bacterium]